MRVDPLSRRALIFEAAVRLSPGCPGSSWRSTICSGPTRAAVAARSIGRSRPRACSRPAYRPTSSTPAARSAAAEPACGRRRFPLGALESARLLTFPRPRAGRCADPGHRRTPMAIAEVLRVLERKGGAAVTARAAGGCVPGGEARAAELGAMGQRRADRAPARTPRPARAARRSDCWRCSPDRCRRGCWRTRGRRPRVRPFRPFPRCPRPASCASLTTVDDRARHGGRGRRRAAWIVTSADACTGCWHGRSTGRAGSGGDAPGTGAPRGTGPCCPSPGAGGAAGARRVRRRRGRGARRRGTERTGRRRPPSAQLLEVRAQARRRRGDLAGARSDLRVGAGVAPRRPGARRRPCAAGDDRLRSRRSGAGVGTRRAGARRGRHQPRGAAPPALRCSRWPPCWTSIWAGTNGRPSAPPRLWPSTALTATPGAPPRCSMPRRCRHSSAVTCIGGTQLLHRAANLFEDSGDLMRLVTPRSTRGHGLVFQADPGRGLGRHRAGPRNRPQSRSSGGPGVRALASIGGAVRAGSSRRGGRERASSPAPSRSAWTIAAGRPRPGARSALPSRRGATRLPWTPSAIRFSSRKTWTCSAPGQPPGGRWRLSRSAGWRRQRPWSPGAVAGAAARATTRPGWRKPSCVRPGVTRPLIA